PDITVTKTADPTEVSETGGSVTFTGDVLNNSPQAAALDALSDDVFGDLDGVGDCVTGGTIAAGATYSCSFTETVSGDFSGLSHLGEATATGSDNDGHYDPKSE